MGNKSWQELATKAKDIARRIVNGDEENKNGERLIHIVYRLDTFATNALNKKFAQSGSIGSVHTYAGGTQVISTRHADGSEGSFNTDGECTPTDNPMDIEVDAYINGGNGGGGGQSSPAAAMVLPESKTNKNMKKNVIKLNENTFRKIVAESVKKVLKENNGKELFYNKLNEIGQKNVDMQIKKFQSYGVDNISIEQLYHELSHMVEIVSEIASDMYEWLNEQHS